MNNALRFCILSLLGAVLLALPTLAQSNPVPFINNPLVPDAAAPGGASFTLTVNGTGFVSGSVVTWNSSALATTFVSGSQLTASVPASNIARAGTASVTVASPVPGGGVSNIDFLSIRSPFSESSFGLSSFGSFPYVSFVLAVDVNQDGKLDLITDSPEDVYVSLGNGDGTFQPAIANQVPVSPAVVIASDFNRDGKIDLAVTAGGFISILIGNGDGTFQPYQNAPGGANFVGVVAGDFNGDGKQDLAATDYSPTGDVAILLGNGDGTFQNPVNYPAAITDGEFITTGDFNDDGVLDLAVSVTYDSAVAVLLGNGDGSFQNGVEYATPMYPYYLLTADFNQDGMLDLAVATYGTQPSTGSVSVLLGNGNGTFQPHVDYPTFGSTSLSAGDLDGDGKLDLIATSPPGGKVTGFPGLAITYMGQGDGTFRNKGYFAAGSFPESLALGDFNGDGMLDMASANSDSGAGNASVLLQATGVLSRTIVTFPETTVGSKSTAKVTLSNIGHTSFGLTNWSIKGINASVFSETNDCGPGLSPGAKCTITVTFQPTYSGTLRGTQLEIRDGAVNGRQTVYLRGIALANNVRLRE